MAFSSDGSMLAEASGTTITIWDVATWTDIITITDRSYSICLAFSPDGSVLASGLRNNTIELWDVVKRANIATLEGHTDKVISVSFSPDGSILASASEDETVKLWNMTNKKNIATLEGGRWSGSVSFSPDGSILGYGSSIHKLWDVASRREISIFGGYSRNVAFSPDGSILASASGSAIKLWDIIGPTLIATLGGHTGPVTSVSFSPDGTMLVSGSWDSSVKLWDMSEWLAPRPTTLVKVSGDNQQGTSSAELTSPFVVEVRDQYGFAISSKDIPVRFTVTTGNGRLNGRFNVFNVMTDAVGLAQSTLTLGPNPGINTVEVSYGIKSVAFNAVGVGTPAIPIMGGDYQTWHLPKDAVVRLGKGAIGENDRAVAFSPDGQYLAVASGIGIWLYEVATSQPLALLPSESRVNSVVFPPDGTLLASGLENGRVELWEVETGTKVATLDGHGYRRVTSVVFSPDGTLLASGSGDQIIKLWDIKKREEVGTWEEDWRDESSRVSVVFSPDGTTLAAGFRDGTIRLWDIATRTTIAELDGSVGYINSVALSPDGTILASGSRDDHDRGSFRVDRTIKLWNIATKRNIATLEGHTREAKSVAFSPDGTILASGSRDGTIKLWDVATRTNIATLEGHTDGVESVAFSSDGTRLVSGSWDRTIKLWDVATQTNIAILEGEGRRSGVNAVSFSLDGTLLASGAWDGGVKLWDVMTRRNIAAFGGHTSRVNTVVFSPDGKKLFSGSDDGTVLLWDMSSYIKPQAPASAPTPDFDGDGTVGIPDFLQFVEQFGFGDNDEGYEARFDLDGDGVIGISDFLIFVDSFGKKVSS